MTIWILTMRGYGKRFETIGAFPTREDAEKIAMQYVTARFPDESFVFKENQLLDVRSSAGDIVAGFIADYEVGKTYKTWLMESE